MPKSRKAKKRSPYPMFHIYCEGEKTEPNYIEDYIKRHCEGFRLIQVRRIGYDETVKIAKTNKTDPCSLVRMAIREKSVEPRGDEFWCVYDREAENKVPEKIHEDAWKMADQNGVKIALSNVCFEFWLLLHQQYTTAAYCSYDDLFKRSKLTAWYPNYEKGERRAYEDKDIKKAIANAKRLLADAEKSGRGDFPYRMNPFTNIHELIGAINDFFQRNDMRRLCGR